jgi:hypothetical protein
MVAAKILPCEPDSCIRFGSSQKGKKDFFQVAHLFSYLQIERDIAHEKININHPKQL